jgi:hypothetical protein
MPPAATAAARNRTERRTVSQPQPAPRTPRRISGPVQSPQPVRRNLAPQPAPARRRPVPRPAPDRLRPAPRQRRRIGLAFPSPLALLRSLPDKRLLDRLIRGRAWIPVLGVLLAGIVAMRVEVLKLGVSVGNSVALASELQSENQTMRANVASLSNAARIERLAGTMGMVLPGPLDVHFIPASGTGDLGSAVAGIASPDPTTFESELQSETAANSASLSAVAPSSTADTLPTTSSTTVAATSGG